jgi:hypothetical protein
MKNFIYYLKYWLNFRKLKDRILWEFSKKDLNAILKYDNLDLLRDK